MIKMSNKLVFWIDLTRRVHATRFTFAMATSLFVHPSEVRVSRMWRRGGQASVGRYWFARRLIAA
jgi:hypothetical protein